MVGTMFLCEPPAYLLKAHGFASKHQPVMRARALL